MEKNKWESAIRKIFGGRIVSYEEVPVIPKGDVRIVLNCSFSNLDLYSLNQLARALDAPTKEVLIAPQILLHNNDSQHQIVITCWSKKVMDSDA